jgi:twinkle protein
MGTLVRHEPCPKCQSKDNLARYADGTGWCWGCTTYFHADGKQEHRPINNENTSRPFVTGGTPRFLDGRGIKKETCEFWKYEVGQDERGTFHVANYFDERGQKVAQKIRHAGKKFEVRGGGDGMLLYGQWLWPDKGKSVTITEGEIDALTVSQVFNNKWPVVSLPKGAAAAPAAIKKSLKWLNGFDRIVLMFDMDEPGRKAVAEVAPLLPAGKCYIASLPEKDANATLLKPGGSDIISDAFWQAKQWRPSGIVSFKDIKAKALKPIETGLPWFLPKLTKLTHGRRWGEIYTFGAGTGVGKTDFLTEQIKFDATELNQKVALYFLEQEPEETAKRVAGKVKDKRFHVPDDSWTQDELAAALDELEKHDNVRFYDHFGCADWTVIENHIRYLTQAEGVRIHYVDHLTALADPAHERESLETLMGALGGLVKELKIIVILVSHLSTPEGKPHEEGGRVTIRHFKGSRSIGFWSHYMFGMERNQQASDLKKRQQTTFRVLKDRYTGQATGETFYLGYDAERGRLHETQPAFEMEDDEL